MKRVVTILMLIGLLLFQACASAPGVQPVTEMPAPAPKSEETQSPISEASYPEAVSAAQAELANKLNLVPAQVQG